MRYELSDYEWTAIKPMLPNKPRGVRRVNDRRVLNGIFWVLRSGAPWRDLPETYGPRTTCYNRFVRWRRAGVWDQIMDALAAGHDAAVQMIDTSVVRVHQHGACIADNNHQDMGRSRGGLTSKIHAVVDTNGLPVHLALTPGEAHDNRLCSVLLSALLPQTMLLADRGYDADWIRELARQQGAWANIPPKRNRKDPICFSPYLYRARNLIERFFNKIKQCRRVATRYDKLAANYLAFVKYKFRTKRAYRARNRAPSGFISSQQYRLNRTLFSWPWEAGRALHRAKVLELSEDHWFGNQVALEALVRFSDEELKHQALFRLCPSSNALRQFATLLSGGSSSSVRLN